MEPIGLHDGRLMQVHAEAVCVGPHCCIHNPSDHPLNTAPLSWRNRAMVRVCPHGVEHPDPDDLAHKRRALGEWMSMMHDWESHHCDGCCGGNPTPGWTLTVTS